MLGGKRRTWRLKRWVGKVRRRSLDCLPARCRCWKTSPKRGSASKQLYITYRFTWNHLQISIEPQASRNNVWRKRNWDPPTPWVVESETRRYPKKTYMFVECTSYRELAFEICKLWGVLDLKRELPGRKCGRYQQCSMPPAVSHLYSDAPKTFLRIKSWIN